MKVKIGLTTFDAVDVPIMIILNNGEKKQISDMASDATKYCQFPDNLTIEQIEEFMETTNG